MTDHPLTKARAKELWNAHIPERKAEYLGWDSFPEPSRRYLTAILHAAFDAGREHEREHTDPTLPAEVTDEMVLAALNAERRKDRARLDSYPADAASEMRAALEAALAGTPTDPHHDPRPWKDCTRKDIRQGDLVEPPAEEVALPTEFGAVITDVDTGEGGRFTRMARTGPEHFTQGPNPLLLRFITAFTLPDGTRARRDGDHEDGTPRFVKVQEEEEK